MREFIIATIGKIWIQNPEITVVELIKVLNRNEIHNVTENYIGRLRDIAILRRIQRVRRQTAERALAEHDGNLSEALARAWYIATDNAITPSIRLGALNTIAKISEMRYQMLLASDQIEDGDVFGEKARTKVVFSPTVTEKWKDTEPSAKPPLPAPTEKKEETRKDDPGSLNISDSPDAPGDK